MAEVKEMEKLPEGWKRVKLWEVIKETFPGEWGKDPLGNKDIFPVFSTLAIDYNGRIDFSKALFRKLNRNKFKKLKLSKDTILIEKSGGSTDTPAGKVAIIKNDFEGTCSNFIQILKAKEDICGSLYLFYWLYYNFKNNLINKYQQRTTGIINFILNDYFNDCLNLPPLHEQCKIAEILETVDNAIEKTSRIIEKYKRIKQGLMQDLLTKGIDENGQIRREETHRFKDSPLGRIPEEWEVVEFYNLFDVIDNRGRTPPFSESGTIPYLSAENIRDGKILYNFGNFVTDEVYKRYMRGIPTPGHILFTTEAPLGEVAPVPAIKFCFAQRVIAIKPKMGCSNYYLFLIQHELIQRQLNNVVSGTTVKGISAKNLKKVSFIALSLPEQHRIVSILSQIDEAIEKEQRYKEKLERIKQGLMEDLLTGKVRVNNLIEGVENVSQT